MQRKKLEKHWFKHDISASSDNKIAELEMNHGFVGYAVYFKLIEQLYLNDGKLEYNNAKIAWRLRAPDDKETLQMISSVIEDFGLFKFDENNLIYSPRALNGLEEILSKSKKAKDSALKRHNKKDDNNNSENDDLPF
tara:strand:- start:632 stop:1042 length:411 start_codon:yes stop_codon:yes gene_type:complete